MTLAFTAEGPNKASQGQKTAAWGTPCTETGWVLHLVLDVEAAADNRHQRAGHALQAARGSHAADGLAGGVGAAQGCDIDTKKAVGAGQD